MNRILVVDDCMQNRELLGFMLEEAGYAFVYAEDGQQAIDLTVADDSIDLILMDIAMPVMDGITATCRIKAALGERLVPVIFVTFMDDSDLLAQCLSSGGDDFIPKPVNATVLLAKIQAHKRTQALNQSLQEANKVLAVHRRETEREHAIVERIFERSGKRLHTRCRNLHTYTSPMSMFNGDVLLEAPSPEGGVYVLVGDFTGHGLAAAVGTLPVSEIFFRLAAQQASVADFASEMNRSLLELLPSNMFCCAAIAYVDAEGKNLSVWMGGMNDIVCVSADGKNVRTVSSQHMPLGILTEAEFDRAVRELSLGAGERIFIYSDGVYEAQNHACEQFGTDGILQVVSTAQDDCIPRLVDAVQAFQEGAQADDLSIVEIVAGPIVHLPIAHLPVSD